MSVLLIMNRAEFFAMLEPFLAPSTLLDVQVAYTFAKFGHRAQVRKETDADGKPVRYFEHVRRVAINVVQDAKIVLPELVIAALIHDGLEDTRDITPEMTEHLFGKEVAMIVKTLSKCPEEGYLERFHMCTDWRAYVVKACDRLDNLRSLSQASPEFQAKQIKETRAKYYDLFDKMIVLTPPEYRARTQSLRDAIIKQTEGHRISP